MYSLDVNDPEINEKLKDKKIVVPKETSRLYQYAKNSEAMERWIVENYDRIKNGEKPLKDSIEFPLGSLKDAINGEKRGLFATIHRADLNGYKVNDDGSLVVTPDDIYNFEEWDEKHDGKNIKKKVENAIYNRYMQPYIIYYILIYFLIYIKKNKKSIGKRDIFIVFFNLLNKKAWIILNDF